MVVKTLPREAGPIRTLPPWIQSYEEGEATDQLLSSTSLTHAAEHHSRASSPTHRRSLDGYEYELDAVAAGGLQQKQETNFFGGHRHPERGRKWDHLRTASPVIMQSDRVQDASQWVAFVKSSEYPRPLNEDSRIEPNILETQNLGYQLPWGHDLEGANDLEKRIGRNNRKQKRNMIEQFQYTLLMHPLVPLGFRVTVFITSVIALGISASVHPLSRRLYDSQNPSNTMAIAVDVVAIPYILYVTWDEYTGKPLGLRSAKTKIRLVLLDLFFIILESANLATAFDILGQRESGCHSPTIKGSGLLCQRNRALCGILMLALLAWSLTFSVSIFRLVHRVGARGE